MKNIYLSFVVMVVLAGHSITPNAQTIASKTTEAGAALITAISLTESAPLHFGSNIMTGSAGGKIMLPANSGTLTFSGEVTHSTLTPAPANAAFVVTGTAFETYALMLPTSATVTHTSVNAGVNTMEITQISARFNGASTDAITSVLSASGTDSFTLGGTLIVQANQVGGAYSGTFTVTVNYN